MSLPAPYSEVYYVADGETVTFAFGQSFSAPAEANVKCVIYFGDGTSCVPDFTVNTTTGYITIVTLTKPDGTVLTVPPEGSIVRVFRDTPEQQNVTASQLQNYTAKQLERIFDSIVAMIQENTYTTEHKTVRLTETQRDVSLAVLTELVDGHLLYWDDETSTLQPTDFPHEDVVRCVGGLFFRVATSQGNSYLQWSLNQVDWNSINIGNIQAQIDDIRELAQQAMSKATNAKETADEAKEIAEDAKGIAEGIEDIAQDALDKVTQEITDREDADSDLQDQIDSLSGRGRFLALWNCATGLAETNPPESPYTYHSGDYFIVGTISTATPAVNYKPDGSSYTTGVASTTVETNEVSVNDTYFYDGTVWKLQSNAQKEVSFSALAGSPYDNTNLSNVLNAKQDVIQVSTMPVASADNLGQIVQWIGTDGTYTNGFFYKNVATTTASGTIAQTFGASLSDITLDVETFQEQIDEAGTYIFYYDGAEWYYGDDTVDLGDYGISFSGDPEQDDELTVVITETTTYGWENILVQRGGVQATYDAGTKTITFA